MSEIPLWGTGIGPGGLLLVRRVTSDGSIRVTSDGSVRVASVRSPVTVPQYFQTDNVTMDGGEPFTFRYETNPFQPPAPAPDGSVQGGEHEFRWLFLSLAWSMAAQIQVTPFVDGERDAVTLPDSATLENVPSVISLDQQAGSLQRLTRVFPVPIIQRKVLNGVEVGRWCLRGERIQFTIESTGALGVGELMLEGMELESTPLRKAIYASVNSGG